ncbi:MAG TPA: hypothetical protein VMM55_11110 [Thermohalobaculum sp.]|nr:hypothetical protein [Thermohalobaculum sp.]
MFDTLRLRPVPGPVLPDEPRQDDFALSCREPAERWMLDRRRWRPAQPGTNLPRVVAT